MISLNNNRSLIMALVVIGFILPLWTNAVNIGGYTVGGQTPVPVEVLSTESLQQLYDYNISKRDSPGSSQAQRNLAILDLQDVRIEQALRANAPAEEISRLRNQRAVYARVVDETGRPSYGSTVAYFADDNNVLEKLDINSKKVTTECGISSWARINQCAINFIAWILNLVAWVLALIMWVASVVFQSILDSTVINFGAAPPNGLGNSPVINTIWGTLRNLVNVSFIFILLYVAISTILRLNDGDNKRIIKNVIIIALLVNFSLFFTRIIIDVSNVLAVQFYNQINKTGDLNIASEFQKRLEIGAPFFGSAGVQPAFEDIESSANGKEWKKVITHYLGAIVLLTAGSMVLIAGALLLLNRATILILLMIFSPLAFGAVAVPGLKKHWDWWLNKLFDQAFFAPFFLFMIYLSFRLLGEETKAVVRGPDQTWTGLLIYQVLLISFMFGAVIVAKKMGAVGAGAATRTMGRVAFGLPAMAARNLIGRQAERWKDRKQLIDQALKDPSRYRRWIAKRKINIYNRLSESSFDMRAAGPGKGLGGLAKSVDIDLGTAHKGGFLDAEIARAKKHEKIARRYNVTNSERVAAALAATEAEKEAGKRTEEFIATDSTAKEATAQYDANIDQKRQEIIGLERVIANPNTDLTARTQAIRDKESLAKDINNLEKERNKFVANLIESIDLSSDLALATETLRQARTPEEKERAQARVNEFQERTTRLDATREARQKAVKAAGDYQDVKDLSRKRRKMYYESLMANEPYSPLSMLHTMFTWETQGSRNVAGAEGWREADKSAIKKFTDRLQKRIKTDVEESGEGEENLEE